MVLQNLLPWLKKNSHDGHRAVSRRRTKIVFFNKRRGWSVNALLLVTMIAIIPIWVHLSFHVVRLKNDNYGELKSDNIVESKRMDDDDTKLFSPKTGRLISKAVLRTFNLATVRNRLFAKLSAWKMKRPKKSKANNVPETNTELKYVLQWTPNGWGPQGFLKTGKKAFVESKCSHTNCYVTNDRHYLNGDVTKFDAVIFNGRSFKTWPHSDLPQARSPHQKYIFMNLESSDNQPVCDPAFDNFFNWTATYKLKSDILLPFFIIKNKDGEVVGPKINMNWIGKMSEVNKTILETVKKKTKAAAWFVSRCTTRCKREEYVENLKNELKDYNLTLDIYGKCGDLKCKSKKSFLPHIDDSCQAKLRDEYFFYLAFENSCVEDYVSEKVLRALRNTVVPIVYGGSNYTRFLPPGSFIDARLYKPRDLASIMAGIIASREVYSELFKWRNHYKYQVSDNACALCTALNDKAKMKARTVYEDFRGWWNPDYKERCKDDTWGT